jgi:hypothetical protein
MLYLATSNEQPLRRSLELSVEEVEPSREAVRQWFSLPIVRFIGAHTGCSCGFPHSCIRFGTEKKAVRRKGEINMDLGGLNREKFFFNEQFFYRVTAEAE